MALAVERLMKAESYPLDIVSCRCRRRRTSAESKRERITPSNIACRVIPSFIFISEAYSAAVLSRFSILTTHFILDVLIQDAAVVYQQERIALYVHALD
jgi:hypothetical protein